MNIFFSHKDASDRHCLTLIVSRDYYRPALRRLLNAASVGGAPSYERRSPSDPNLTEAPCHHYIESTWTLSERESLGSIIQLLLSHQGAKMISLDDYANRSLLDADMARIERLLALDGQPVVAPELDF